MNDPSQTDPATHEQHEPPDMAVPLPARICRAPVFVMGAPRSGTTVVAWALAQHDQLWTCEETQVLWDLLSDGLLLKNYRRQLRGGNSWLHDHGIATGEYLRYIGLGINALFTNQAKGKRWIDHGPTHALFADELLDMFPGARFIHVLRSGHRTINSMINYPVKVEPWSKDFRDACKTWTKYVAKAAEFEAKHPDRCITVRNEELTSNPDKAFGRLFDFLGVDFTKEARLYFQSNRINSSYVITPETPLNHSPPWDAWTEEWREIFLAEAGDLEAKLYPLAGPRIREAIAGVLPQEAVVLVVNKGDDDLLNLSGRRAAPFPQDEAGYYAGYHPGDGNEAVQHLETLRARGATHLLLPCTSFWWLDFYPDFKQHLETRCRRLLDHPACAIFALDN